MEKCPDGLQGSEAGTQGFLRAAVSDGEVDWWATSAAKPGYNVKTAVPDGKVSVSRGRFYRHSNFLTFSLLILFNSDTRLPDAYLRNILLASTFF